jgi:hypothetical protein
MKELARLVSSDDVRLLNLADNKPLLLCNQLSEVPLNPKP